MPAISPEYIEVPNSLQEPERYVRELLQNWPTEQLLKTNLAALRESPCVSAGLADTITAVDIAETARLVVAFDGSVNYRLPHEQHRNTWLGCNSTPRITAEMNIKRLNAGNANLAMNGISNGYDAKNILGVLSPYQALFITESSPLHLSLALRLHDFTNWLGSGKLVLLLGDNPVELLTNFFAANTGYNTIRQTITWTWLSHQENQLYARKVSAAIESVVRKSSDQMNQLYQQSRQNDEETLPRDILKIISSKPSDKHPTCNALRIANCTNTYSPDDYCTSRDILAGFAKAGASVDRTTLDRPDTVSPIAQLARLIRIKPHIILLVDRLRNEMSPTLPKSAICITVLRQGPAALLDSQIPISDKMEPCDLIFCCQGDHLKKLKQAGAPPEQIMLLPIGVNDELFHPVELDSDQLRFYSSDVALIADRFSSDPETYQIKLPTHQQLWNQVAEEITRDPARYNRQTAGQYLLRAQNCGVKLSEDDLIDYFTELIQNFLGETIVRDTYCNTLKTNNVNLRIWSWAGLKEKPPIAQNESATVISATHWSESPVSDLLAGSVGYGDDLNNLYNAAKIFIWLDSTDQPDRYLLNGIAAGAFFLVRSPSRKAQKEGVAGLFKSGKELITFDTPKDLVRKVKYYLTNDQERNRIRKAAREKILAHHTCQKHSQIMLEKIKNLGTGTNLWAQNLVGFL